MPVVRTLIVLVLLALATVQAQAAGPATRFTADVVTTTDGRVLRGKVYVDNGKMRMDTTAGGTRVEVLIRPDRDKMYQIVRAQKTYTELPLRPLQRHNAYVPTAQRTLIGTETVRGIACDKYSVKSGDVMYVFWVRKGTAVPVQMETSDGRSHVEYANVKVGAPPAGTFEVPKGFKKA
jgi:outer membrane lipoprotein-sorting protein